MIHGSDVNRGARPRTSIALHPANGDPDYSDPAAFPVLGRPMAPGNARRSGSTVELLTPSQPAWDDRLAVARRDIYHLAGITPSPKKLPPRAARRFRDRRGASRDRRRADASGE